MLSFKVCPGPSFPRTGSDLRQTSVIQQALVRGDGGFEVSSGSHQHLGYGGQGAPTGKLVPIIWHPAQHEHQGKRIPCHWEAPTPSPSEIVFKVHKKGLCCQGTHVDTHEPPIQEGKLHAPLCGHGFVKLVGGQRSRHRPDAPQCHHQECKG